MDKQILDDFTNSLRSSYEPYYLGFAMHPEEGREAKINDELVKIREDLLKIDETLITTGVQVYTLMTNTILRLNNIHDNIMLEKERYQDMQMLCNKYTDYDKVKSLTKEDFNGGFVYENGDFAPERSSTKEIALEIVDVFGNGYEGNKYVYKDYMYTNTVLDTSLRKNVTDDKITSYYEYSRITVSNVEDAEIPDFNKDNKEATCTITFRSAEPINEIDIITDDSTILITNIAYSINGIDYIDMNIPYISINNKLDSYENFGYIYGSGRISFPYSIQLFKVTFQSTGYKNDVIAYEKVLLPIANNEVDLDFEGTGMGSLLRNDIIWMDSFGESSISESTTNKESISNENIIGTSKDYWSDEVNFDIDELTEEVTTVVKSAQRHVIKLNQVKAYMYNYVNKSKLETKELLNQDVYSVALFANVYIPQGLSDDAVKFILTVNGTDYNVVPINSHMNGIKIIRFSTGNANDIYTKRIGEKIKSAKLSIIFNNESKIVPRVNNIKVLFGGEL